MKNRFLFPIITTLVIILAFVGVALTRAQGQLRSQPSSSSTASKRVLQKRLRRPRLSKRQGTPVPYHSPLPDLGLAREFSGLGPWFNSQPLSLASLGGKVVFVHFWTLGCSNCIATLPHIRGYWSKFKDTSFVLIGVHTPEFTYEKLPSNVQDALKRFSIRYPVPMDNDFGTWNGFSNRYWPAAYIIDKTGHIRFSHFGEGAYDEMERVIGDLLKETSA